MKKPRLIVFEEMEAAIMKMEDEEAGRFIKDMLDYFYRGIDNREEDLGWVMIKSKIDGMKEAYYTRVSNGKQHVSKTANNEEQNPHKPRT